MELFSALHGSQVKFIKQREQEKFVCNQQSTWKIRKTGKENCITSNEEIGQTAGCRIHKILKCKDIVFAWRDVQIQPNKGDFVCVCVGKQELIVFNPDWLIFNAFNVKHSVKSLLIYLLSGTLSKLRQVSKSHSDNQFKFGC